MFFDPKMQLVWVDGPLEKLDAFIENCCVDGKRVHPARALDHMSASAGYAALNEENPWGPLVEQIEALAKGFEIPVVEPTLADGRAQGTRDYLADLQARLETHRKDRDLLEKQLGAAKKVAGDEAMIVYMDPSDEDKARRLAMHHNVTVKISEYSFDGGIRAVIPSKHILIDSSFKTKLEEARHEFKFDLGGKQ